MEQRWSWIAGCVVGALMATAVSVMADSDPTTDSVPRALPYSGVLEFNGEPVHATGDEAVWIRFALYDGDEAQEAIYAQAMAVEVYAGRFTVAIGPVDDEGVAIEEVIRGADDLTLGMTLLGDDPDDPSDDVALANRQRLMATPYALWTTSATNFTVASTLTVGGDVQLNGGTLDLGGGTLRGAETAHIDDAVHLAERPAMVHAEGDVLGLNPGGGFTGGALLDGNARIDGDAHVTGGLTVDGSISGRIVGGGFVACTQNSGTNLACSAWGNATCGGGGCSRYVCTRGTVRVLTGGYNCYSNGSWGRACYSMLCVE